ncbi:MAG: shikimate kinase [Cyanobacteria bacterium]|nr:shikimate kinase [Cyanobacteriota bacterium]
MSDSLDLLRGVNLYLVGMMGAGKSTLGQVVAQRLGYHFLDTDTVIESVAQRPITEIFATDGEAAFRALETAVLQQVVAYTRSVVATGGGMVLRRENWGLLRHGVVVWLDVPLTVLTQRLQRDQSRPLLQRPDWQAHLANLMAQRRPLYQEADIHLTVPGGESVEAVGDRLMAALRDRILPEATVAAPGDH